MKATFRSAHPMGKDLEFEVAGVDSPGAAKRAALEHMAAEGQVVQGIRLDGTDFHGALLDGIRLVGCEFSGDMSGVSMRRATLERCVFRGVDFTGAILTGTLFDGTRLEGANFTRASAAGVTFQSCSLQRAFLVEVDLTEATLAHTRTTQAVFREIKADFANVGRMTDPEAFLLAAVGATPYLRESIIAASRGTRAGAKAHIERLKTEGIEPDPTLTFTPTY